MSKKLTKNIWGYKLSGIESLLNSGKNCYQAQDILTGSLRGQDQQLIRKHWLYFSDMFNAFRNCLGTIWSLPFLLQNVYDIKGWLEPYGLELHGHTAPKCFKFIRNADGKCEMYYRNYSHMPWMGPTALFKVCWSSNSNSQDDKILWLYVFKRNYIHVSQDAVELFCVYTALTVWSIMWCIFGI